MFSLHVTGFFSLFASQGARAGGAGEGCGGEGRSESGGRDQKAPGGLQQDGEGQKPRDRPAL